MEVNEMFNAQPEMYVDDEYTKTVKRTIRKKNS